MTDIENIKAGDYVRITDTSIYEGGVMAFGADGMVQLVGGLWVDLEEYGDHHSVTIEVIEKPREVGWWEVFVKDLLGEGERIYRWDGSDWRAADGLCVGWADVVPLHYIGKGSFA